MGQARLHVRSGPPWHLQEVASIQATGSAVVADGLTRSFEDLTAVSGVSFDLPAGSILGVIGPSGSGKTTTIRMLMGSLAPSEGTVHVLGEDPLHFGHRTRECIGYMPQHFILYPDLTARENVDFVASLFGMLFFRRRRRVRQVLQLLDLWDARGRRAGELSGGMQRRLELACALVHEPRLLILDEPTAGIDPILRRTVWDELHRLREQGVTCVVTTQYVTEAEECDLVALIAEGRLVALAAPDELRRDAYGGDVIDVTTEATFDAGELRAIDSVRGVRQRSLQDFSVVVDDASVALPEIVDAITAAGGTVASAREARPSFEDVFAELVERASAGGPDADRQAAPAQEPDLEPAPDLAADAEAMVPAGPADPPAPVEPAANLAREELVDGAR
ncbi:MAG: ABC transporter ATP-binding protein [Chloroflexi bacterium]|nr:ABC transporter ATP-binding protein [Chloroflexota bacterium]